VSAGAAYVFFVSLHDALPIFRKGGKIHHFPLLRKDLVFECYDKFIHVYPPQSEYIFVNKSRRPLGEKTLYNRVMRFFRQAQCSTDRKSTRLNSSHVKISYAVF